MMLRNGMVVGLDVPPNPLNQPELPCTAFHCQAG